MDSPQGFERVDLETVRSRVVPVVSQFPEIIAVYLFGSALDRLRPDSDIDIGLILDPARDSEKARYELTGKVSLFLDSIGRHSFDVVALDTSDYLFAFRVLSGGVPLYVADSDLLGDVIERVSQEFRENYPRYAKARREVLEEAGILDGTGQGKDS